MALGRAQVACAPIYARTCVRPHLRPHLRAPVGYILSVPDLYRQKI